MKIKIETIILTILWSVSLYSIFVTSTSEYKLNLSNYIAFVTLIGLTGFKLFKIKNLNVILGIILLSGTFNLISYSYSNTTLGFSLNLFNFNININLQLLSLSLLILLVIFDIKSIRKMNRLLKTGNTKIIPYDKDAIIIDFKNQFKDHSVIQLQNIANDKGFAEEAIIAARELLEKID